MVGKNSCPAVIPNLIGNPRVWLTWNWCCFTGFPITRERQERKELGAVKMDSRFTRERQERRREKQGGWKCQMWVYSNRINSLQKYFNPQQNQNKQQKKMQLVSFCPFDSPFAREMTSGW